jgi:hypothetical protein
MSADTGNEEPRLHLTSCNSREDRHDIARFHGCFKAAQVPHVLVSTRSGRGTSQGDQGRENATLD